MSNFNLFIGSVLLYLGFAYPFGAIKAEEFCSIAKGYEEEFTFSDQVVAPKYALEVCSDGVLTTISRLEEIVRTKAVSYFVSQDFCSSSERLKKEDLLSLDLIRKINFECQLSDRTTRMCSNHQKQCDLKNVDNFITTKNINTLQFVGLVQAVKAIHPEIDIGKQVTYPNLNESSNNALKVIKKSNEALEPIYIAFYDYSSFANSGKFEVSARQENKLFVFSFILKEDGFDLKNIGWATE